MGTTFNGNKVGTFGDCAILSFCQNKIISTGEGGAFLTDNKYLYDQAKLTRSHGRQGDYFNADYVTLGYNFRMPSMNAALGISQLERIDTLIEKRRQVAQRYAQYLPLDVVLKATEGHVFQLYTIRSNKRDLIMKHLQEKDIGCKVYFTPIHWSTYYKRDKWNLESLPVTERISKEVLSLPMYPDLSQEEVKEVCDAIKEVL
jgi:dTDP-4-amino-4,6-dideoxygalactose transaminase